jgi:hypothetical protein
MQATLNINDIDGVYLYPYYSNWVDLEKARIEKASLNFVSNIQALNNNLTADCHLELTDIVRRPLKSEEQEEKASRITDAVLERLKGQDQGNIVLDFPIKTKMDKPEFGLGNLKSAVTDKLSQSRAGLSLKAEDIFSFPGKFIEGTVRSATSVTKTVIIGAINAGAEIGRTVEDSFKREKKEETTNNTTIKQNEKTKGQ